MRSSPFRRNRLRFADAAAVGTGDGGAEADGLRQEAGRRRHRKKKRGERTPREPTVKWLGQLQADFYFFDQDEVGQDTYGDIQNGEAFRRKRGSRMLGDYGPAEYRIEM